MLSEEPEVKSVASNSCESLTVVCVARSQPERNHVEFYFSVFV